MNTHTHTVRHGYALHRRVEKSVPGPDDTKASPMSSWDSDRSPDTLDGAAALNDNGGALGNDKMNLELHRAQTRVTTRSPGHCLIGHDGVTP